MLNIQDLEARHKKYKRKALFPYLALTASLVISALFMALFLSYDFYPKVVLQEQEILQVTTPALPSPQMVIPPTSEVKALQTEALKEEKPKPQEMTISQETMTTPEEKKVILSPSLDFIDTLQSQGNASPQKQHLSPNKITNQEIIEKPIVTTQKSQEKENIEVLPKQEIQNSINIKRKDDDDLKDVIRRFNNNHNPALSLFIAKKYYQAQEYEQAYNYALATNEINNNIEESWILFSKSLTKLGKKEMAIETLQKYINHSHSSQAKQLLDEIQSGKFQ